ncbi:PH, RCC1 and FYVE domains-containing protein 1-like [Bidens hawaiensis]|uniref:PH, RCC1 and FYVE domains-containing protein 1-like n=1 Tax=Bidens hawaiensis TaxID=980011 RepID=UPI00404B4E44
MTIAKEESSKCIAAKEVIKSLTSELKEMAERLPVGAARNIKSPSLTFNISSADITSNTRVDSVDPVDRSRGQTMPYEEPDSNNSNSQLKPNAINNHSSTQNKPAQSAATRNSSRSNNSESQNGVDEWVEQDEPGVYITLTSLPGGIKDLKRVRFSRKRFSEKQAEQWWAENRTRVYEKYNVRMLDKSSVGIPNE